MQSPSLSSPDFASEPVVIVGAGVAGLICAIELRRAGRQVLVLEREEEVGGRVRSRHADGYVVDRGFQVLFTAYPTLNEYLDHRALALRTFLPAARIAVDGTSGLIGDALRVPSLLLTTITAPQVSTSDKLRVLSLRRLATSLSVDECFAAEYDAVSARDFLAAREISPRMIQRFFVPFYGGILLDRSLSSSAAVLLFTLKMLSEGDTAVPARGMGAITAQLAATLGTDAVRTGAGVRALVRDADGICGVLLASGETIATRAVVIATEPAAAATLAREVGGTLEVPREARGCTTILFTADEAPLPGKAIWLNAGPGALVAHAVTLTEVAPEYAPAGRHLLSATIVTEGASTLDDLALIDRAVADLRRMAGGELPALVPIDVTHVPYAQFAQRPGYRARRPAPDLGVRGLTLASELLHSSSLEGAARGGQQAAQHILARGG